jgi:hypothetical protein
MRLLVGFALVLLGIGFVQGQLVIPTFNNLDVLSLIPQLQGFIGQLDQILPQLAGILSSVELQSLKDKITQLFLSQLGGNLDINAIKDKLRPLLQQYLGSKPQGRFDIDAIIQQITSTAVAALPGLVLGLLGKRELPTSDARAGLSDLLSLVDKYQLQTIIPHIEQFIGADKLQQLQNLFFATVVTGLGNNWNLATLSQALQQLVTQFVPQAAQMRIDWEAIAQSALNGLASALPSIAIGALSLFGKRELPVNDARAGLTDLLSLVDKYQLQTIIPHIEQFVGADKLQELQNLFFTTVVTGLGSNWNLATLSQALQQLVTQFIPQASQMRIDWDAIAQSALNGLVTALPSIAIGALSLFGKRGLGVDYQQLLSELSIQKLAQIVQVVSSADKAAVFAKLRQLLQSLFPAYRGRINFDDLAAAVLNQLNNLLPNLSQSIFSTLLG